MIMIDSKAGQRWVRAFVALKQAKSNLNKGGSSAPFYEAFQEFEKASEALGEDLIPQGHHLAEDYT